MKKSKESKNSPYMSKNVRILNGEFQGVTGNVNKVFSRGWFALDNPILDGKKLHVRDCEFLDDTDASLKIIQQTKRKQESTSSHDKQQRNTRQKQMEHLDSATQGKISSSALNKSIARNPISTKSCQTKKVMITSTMRESSRIVDQEIYQHFHPNKQSNLDQTLQPFILDCQAQDNTTHEMLQHLPSDYKVEVFNRRTGRILKGDNAIPLKDLPSVLRRHAEFEPLIPPPQVINMKEQNTQSTSLMEPRLNPGDFSRQARSSLNTRVNNDVQPQIRVRSSRIEGRWVKVISGPYQGSIGRIDSCIPGNWYLLSQLSKKNKYDLDYIVHARSLEILDLDDPSKGKMEKHDISVSDEDNEDLSLILPLTNNIKMLEEKILSLEHDIDDIKSSNKEEDLLRIETLQKELKEMRGKLITDKITYKMLEGTL